MQLTDISNLRLLNQQINAHKFSNARDIANWMGAVQSQDFSMSKWAFGIRLGNSTDKAIENEINNGQILRTHVLRPTLHLVSAENIRWLLKLTAPGIKSRLKSRHNELELTESLFKKCSTIIRNTLEGDMHLTREELFALLVKAKIRVENQRGYHILVRAELDGLVCSGIVKGGKQTYALLDERVPVTKDLTREESLKKIARIYFSSRGPAASQDFQWWSGLSASDSRNALEIVKPDLVSEKAGSNTFWLLNSPAIPEIENTTVHLLPAFDEFLISYKDRSASLPLVNFKKAVSENGIFRPVIVVNGHVKGLWKRTIKKNKVIIETELFEPVNKSIQNQIEKGMEAFGGFLEINTEYKRQ
jgi:hypothetical protein